MTTFYLGLLTLGVASFVVHFGAPLVIARLLRRRHPHEWQIILGEEGPPPTLLRIWMRLQLALRSPVLPVLEDRAVTAWRNAWRYSQYLAWLCWLGAVGILIALH